MNKQPLSKEEYSTLMKTCIISTLLNGVAQLTNKNIEEIENSCIELCLESLLSSNSEDLKNALSKIREDEEANYQLYLEIIKNE